MAEAIKLARRGFYSTDPNPRVGCLIVKDNKLISSGWHEIAGGPHAEINALKQKGIAAHSEIYITLEPCSHHGRTPPCVDSIIELKPERVVIAMQDPNPLVSGKGIVKLKAAKIDVIVGILENEARELNCGFISRFEKQKPFVRIKMATSLDGKTALNNGESQWITGEPARRDVQFLRARCSAILTSASTVLSDDPRLDIRLSRQDLGQHVDVRQPVRVVVDSKLRLTGKEKLFNQGGPVWIYTLSRDISKHRTLSEAGANITVLEQTSVGQIDLTLLLKHLAKRDINEVHTECGQSLAGALLQQNLVDELIIYMAPQILGSQARGAYDIGELTDMKSRLACKMKQVRSIGDDLRITLTPELN
ncbi:MAG: bifunctional diaminohydroxyphosphoribosylaminopyrimidine deaminase/5-amino-6-(5-phosphoribosylamino)uracil reductase RibD [Planctomycetota bacterium]